MDGVFDNFQRALEEENKKGIIIEPASEHKNWKWVMMWESWKTVCEYQRRSKYCYPDLFSMHIYNDFRSYEPIELIENLVRRGAW